jgi:hypothetical protein
VTPPPIEGSRGGATVRSVVGGGPGGWRGGGGAASSTGGRRDWRGRRAEEEAEVEDDRPAHALERLKKDRGFKDEDAGRALALSRSKRNAVHPLVVARAAASACQCRRAGEPGEVPTPDGAWLPLLLETRERSLSPHRH